MNEHYEELQSLFMLDPLLVFAVAYICPHCDVAYLCNKIYLPYAIALVNKNTSDMYSRLGTEVKCMHNLLLNSHVFIRILACPLSCRQCSLVLYLLSKRE